MISEYHKIGAWWVAAQIIILTAIALAPGAHAQWKSPAMGLVIIAVAVFLAAMLTLGRSLSPFPVPVARGGLVTGGIFRVVRHPIYSAVVLATAALAQLTHSLPRALLTLVLFLFFNSKALYEERLLSDRYPSYKGYASKTKRFIPWVY